MKDKIIETSCPCCQKYFAIKIEKEYSKNKEILEEENKRLSWTLKDHMKNECKLNYSILTKWKEYVLSLK